MKVQPRNSKKVLHVKMHSFLFLCALTSDCAGRVYAMMNGGDFFHSGDPSVDDSVLEEMIVDAFRPPLADNCFPMHLVDNDLYRPDGINSIVKTNRQGGKEKYEPQPDVPRHFLINQAARTNADIKAYAEAKRDERRRQAYQRSYKNQTRQEQPEQDIHQASRAKRRKVDHANRTAAPQQEDCRQIDHKGQRCSGKTFAMLARLREDNKPDQSDQRESGNFIEISSEDAAEDGESSNAKDECSQPSFSRQLNATNNTNRLAEIAQLLKTHYASYPGLILSEHEVMKIVHEADNKVLLSSAWRKISNLSQNHARMTTSHLSENHARNISRANDPKFEWSKDVAISQDVANSHNGFCSHYFESAMSSDDLAQTAYQRLRTELSKEGMDEKMHCSPVELLKQIQKWFSKNSI